MNRLIPALRQYRHNNSDGLVAAYDELETRKIVVEMDDEIRYLKEQLDRTHRIKEVLRDHGSHVESLEVKAAHQSGEGYIVEVY